MPRATSDRHYYVVSYKNNPPFVTSHPQACHTMLVNGRFVTAEEAKNWINEYLHNQSVKDIVKSTQEITLSDEQQRILALVEKGDSVFFTGPAGTGKSVLLRRIIEERTKKYSAKNIAVTATTGIAAIAIGGQTVHSYAGVGLGKETAPQLVCNVQSNLIARERWEHTKVWVIDEISMLDGQLFDKLEYIARVFHDDKKPFGGIQLILTGDFFQLPPIAEKGSIDQNPGHYVFEAESWDRCIQHPYFLQQVFRQKDNVFIEILSAIRLGKLQQCHAALLYDLQRPLISDQGIEPAILLATRKQVKQCNEDQLDALQAPAKTYVAVDSAGYNVLKQPLSFDEAKYFLDQMLALDSICLKVGAQVMLIKNIEQGVLVNGSLGKVVDFLTIFEAQNRGIKICTPNDPPTEDMDPFPLTQLPNPPRRSYVQKQIIDLYRRVPELARRSAALRPMTTHFFARNEKWPLVMFRNKRELLCAPTNFEHINFMGGVEARRLQVPLILSWAITIHKSQGQTLDFVKVDFDGIFEKGQAYVALSRATSMEGLQIVNFSPTKIKPHPKVIKWHEYWMRWWEVHNQEQFAEEMDCEEAIQNYWDQSSPIIPNDFIDSKSST